MKMDMERLGWTDTCCLCGRNVVSWNNPDPVRDGNEGNCCEECNRLVLAVRRRQSELPCGEREAFIAQVVKMSYDELVREFL